MNPWKPRIIALTENPAAREGKRDASFFPPVSEERLRAWEIENNIAIPKEIRSFLAESDGLEAQCGEMWPVHPLGRWQVLEDLCVSSKPSIRFGETVEYCYLLSPAPAQSIYRHPRFGSDEEFFASSFSSYLEKIYRGQG